MSEDTVTIGVDLGGTNLRVAAFRANGERLRSVAMPTRLADGRAAVLDDMAEAILSLRAELANADFAGVGIGSPGPLELPRGVLRLPPNLPGWDGLELRAEMERRLGEPVWINSDANLAALAEAMHGSGKHFGIDSLCMITLGTGVGGGIILNGHIFAGQNGAAGEIGHGPLIAVGAACGCGARGCLETYASATAIRRQAIERGIGGGTALSAAELGALADSGDPEARRLFAHVGHCLGLSLANLVNTLNLPLYVIGGGASAAWHLFAPKLFETLRQQSYVYRMSQPDDPLVFEAGKTNVRRAELGSDAGLLGAAMLPLVEKS